MLNSIQKLGVLSYGLHDYLHGNYAKHILQSRLLIIGTTHQMKHFRKWWEKYPTLELKYLHLHLRMSSTLHTFLIPWLVKFFRRRSIFSHIKLMKHYDYKFIDVNKITVLTWSKQSTQQVNWKKVYIKKTTPFLYSLKGHFSSQNLPRTRIELWLHKRHCFTRVIFPVFLLFDRWKHNSSNTIQPGSLNPQIVQRNKIVQWFSKDNNFNCLTVDSWSSKHKYLRVAPSCIN